MLIRQRIRESGRALLRTLFWTLLWTLLLKTETFAIRIHLLIPHLVHNNLICTLREKMLLIPLRFFFNSILFLYFFFEQLPLSLTGLVMSRHICYMTSYLQQVIGRLIIGCASVRRTTSSHHSRELITSTSI